MSDLFRGENHADLYKKYRPVYPDTIIERIVELCKQNGASFKYAVDVGCGSGQSTLGLRDYYGAVVGIDVSEAQISNAPRNISNVTFQTGTADDLSRFQTGTIDLITVATAIHWIDREKFYKEVHRILSPNGVLAIYSYGNPCLDKSAGSELVAQVCIV